MTSRAVLPRIAAVAFVLTACGGGESVKGTAFTSKLFEVPFTITVPTDWTIVERHPEIAQLWQGDDEEKSTAELTLTTEVGATAGDALHAVQADAAANAGTVTKATYGPYDVQQVDVVAPEANTLPGEYRLKAGGRVRVVFFDLDNRDVTAILDAFADVEPKEQVDRMLGELAKVLETLRFKD